MAVTKDYRKIGAANITKPSKLQRRPNFHIYGGNKKGKTHLAMSGGVDRTLIIDPEHGTDPFKTKDPNVWHISDWAELDDVYNFIKLGDHPYEWVAMDGLTKMSMMALRFVMRLAEERSLDRQPGMVDRRDYNKSGELMRTMLTNFHNLPQGIIFTSQERMVEAGGDSEEDEDSDTASAMFVPDLPKGVRGMVNSLVDVIGRIYVVRTEVNGKEVPQRRLWIGESVKYDTGYRSDYGPLPQYIKNPTIPRLQRLIETGSVATRKE